MRDKDHYILLGDFNFKVGDSSSPQGDAAMQNGFRASWESLVQKAKLVEVFQPSDTWFSPSDNPHHTNSSRIDRIYLSQDLYFNNAYDPQTNMAFIPFGVLGSYRKKGRNGTATFHSDHNPV